MEKEVAGYSLTALELLNGLADVLSVEADHANPVEPVVEYIRGVVRADKICAVVFSAHDEAKAYCCKNDTCGECGELDLLLRFASRMSAVTTEPLVGQALTALLSEEEARRFKFQNPVFMPVLSGERILGAMWLDAGPEGAESLADAQERLELMFPLIRVAFNESYVHESQTSQKKTLERILDNLDANIYVSDLYSDEVLFINKKMSAEFDMAGDVRGRKCWQVLQDGFTGRCSFCPSYKLAADPWKPVVWEEHNTVTGKHYKNTDSVIEWVDGRLVHLQHSVDITDSKEHLRVADEARKQAELASRAKGDFLSRMSHEIRTPINAIIGMSRIAAGSGDLDKVQDCIRKIDSSSKQLLGLINDILDMSKIEAGKMELSHERLDIEKMLMDIANVITIKAEEKRQRLHIRLDTAMPRFFKGDELRLAQIITNLSSNAVKFTPVGGRVALDVRGLAEEAGRFWVEFRVEDSGIGIPKERQDRLFKSFEQADGGITRKFGGTGLGLAISKSIVEMMGGSIWVESEEGRGSNFIFKVPLERDGSVTTGAGGGHLAKSYDVAKLKALYLDDDEEAGSYFVKVMDSFGISSQAFNTSLASLKAIEGAARDGRPFNLVFADWAGAGADGLNWCLGVKKRFGIEFIILTTMTQWDELKPIMEPHGIARHLSKPLFPSNIMNAICEAVGVPVRREKAVRARRYNFTGRQALLAEDVEINREIVHQALEGTGLSISNAVNGREAVEMFSAAPGLYDLILMDVNMPEMDGYEATRRIRALPKRLGVDVPILAMTANAFAEDTRRSLASGMNDHITKPLDFDVLLAKLQQYLSPSRLEAPPTWEAKAEPRPAPPPKAAPANADDSGRPVFLDVEEALDRLGDGEIYKLVLAKFIQQPDLERLAAEAEKGDVAAMRETAHKIKGSSGNLSLKALYHSSAALEAALREGRMDQELYRACVDSYKKTKEMIGEYLEGA